MSVGNRGATLRYLVFIVGVAFIVYLCWQSRAVIAALIPNIDVGLFLLSIIIALLGTLVTSLFFHRLLHKYHQDTELKLTIDMYFFGQLAKYIPGKVWSLVFQRLLSQGQISSSSIVLSNIDLTILQINNSVVVGACLILALGHWYGYMVSVVLLGFVTCHYLSTSCFNERCVVFASRWIHRFAKLNIACDPRISLLQSLSFYSLFVIANVVSNVFLLISVFGLGLQQALFYTGLFALSWVVGVITMVSPAGMGVRELVFIFLAKLTGQQVDDASLAAIATIARLWMIFQEISSAALLYAYNNLRKKYT